MTVEMKNEMKHVERSYQQFLQDLKYEKCCGNLTVHSRICNCASCLGVEAPEPKAVQWCEPAKKADDLHVQRVRAIRKKKFDARPHLRADVRCARLVAAVKRVEAATKPEEQIEVPWPHLWLNPAYQFA